MPQPPALQPDLDARRRKARRTAFAFGVVALCVYAGFLLSGALSR